ncbi:cytochrome P450 [Hypomontagnella submonticulosa]|nr:cytochrome P450 [Hypomontagnella submonticulosa]
MPGLLQQVGSTLNLRDLPRLFFFIFLLSVAYQCLRALYNLYLHPLRHIPGPPLWIAFPVVRTLGMVRGTAEFQIREAHAKYGEVIRVSPNQVYFINPQAWKDIYGHGHADFPKHYPKGIHMDPKKIISANASDHFRYRRAMLPAFSDKALAQQEPLMKVYVDLLIERLREIANTGKPTDMVKWYNFTTFDLIADLAYGTPLNGLAEGKSNAWLDNISKLMRYMPVLVLIGAAPVLGLVLKLVAGSKVRNSQANHLALVTKLVNDRIYHRKQLSDRGDFMDYFLRSRGQSHELTDAELIANSDLLMVAGSETTATLLSGVTYWLLRTPHALKRATEEVRNAFDSEDSITFNGVRAKLPYMSACLEEALRLFPPVPLSLSRTVPKGPPVQIAGLTIPEKTIVGVHHLSAYHSELNFHRAQEFIPERWLPESTTNPASPFYNDRRDAHRPFSFGPRDCIGRNLANHEMRLIMARVLWNFDMSLDEKCSNWHEQRIFALWEKPPLEVTLKQRKA